MGRFVHVDPNPVAEPVPEVLAEAGLVDHRSRRGVRLLGFDAGTRRFQASALRLETDVVGSPELIRKLAGRERTRAVGAVPVENRAGIDHDRRPGLDHAVTRVGMGLGAVRARGDDRLERLLVGAELVQE